MTEAQSILIELIASVLCDKPTTFTELSDDTLQEVYEVAKRQDLSHFIGAALTKKKIKVSDTAFKHYQNIMFQTAVRMQRISYEFENVCRLLEQSEIQFIPLKGAVIKSYYPEAWLRTSCDIDILVHESDIEKGIAAINSSGRFNVSERHFHDVSLTAKGINIELHFSILEANDKLDCVLKDVWKYARVREKHKYLTEFTPEFLMFHIYAHAAYHFLKGGCGVKPLMDIYLLESKLEFDRTILEELLEKAEIKRLRRQLLLLSKTWFANGKGDELTASMENYIFSGGVYGTRENNLSVMGTKGDSNKFALQLIFLPYENMKIKYPVLQKHKYLTPIFEVVRWISFVFKGNYEARINDVKYFNSISDSKKQEIDIMLKKLGLREDIK